MVGINSLMFCFDRFPLELSLLLGLLEPLSRDEAGSLCTYHFLCKMAYYCEEFNPTKDMIEDPDNENIWFRNTRFSPLAGTWNRNYHLLYTWFQRNRNSCSYKRVCHSNDQRWAIIRTQDYNDNMLPLGTEVISWQCLEYSAFDYFTFEASFIYQFPNSSG